MRTAVRAPNGRAGGLVEYAAEILRLLAWTTMVAGYGLMLWTLSGSAYASGRTDVMPWKSASVIEAPRGKAARPSEHSEARP